MGEGSQMTGSWPNGERTVIGAGVALSGLRRPAGDFQVGRKGVAT